MKEKKGISPLIATVLLVGLVVLIAMIVFFWYGNYLEDIFEKQGIDLKSSCVQDVEIALGDINCNFNAGNSIVTFYLENLGSVELRGSNIVYSSGTETGSILKSEVINQAVKTYLEANLGHNFSGNNVSLEVTPIIGIGATNEHCENAVQYVTIAC